MLFDKKTCHRPWAYIDFIHIESENKMANHGKKSEWFLENSELQNSEI